MPHPRSVRPAPTQLRYVIQVSWSDINKKHHKECSKLNQNAPRPRASTPRAHSPRPALSRVGPSPDRARAPRLPLRACARAASAPAPVPLPCSRPNPPALAPRPSPYLPLARPRTPPCPLPAPLVCPSVPAPAPLPCPRPPGGRAPRLPLPRLVGTACVRICRGGRSAPGPAVRWPRPRWRRRCGRIVYVAVPLGTSGRQRWRCYVRDPATAATSSHTSGARRRRHRIHGTRRKLICTLPVLIYLSIPDISGYVRNFGCGPESAGNCRCRAWDRKTVARCASCTAAQCRLPYASRWEHQPHPPPASRRSRTSRPPWPPAAPSGPPRLARRCRE